MRRNATGSGWTLTPLLIGLLPSCGIGTAGLASSGGSSAAGNAAPVASDLRVTNTEDNGQRPFASPASIRFDLTDEEGDPAAVEISFATESADGVLSEFQTITLDEGHALPLESVEPNAGPYEVLWDFESDFGDQAYHDNVVVRLELPDGRSPDAVRNVALGNDSPSLLTNLTPAAGSDGEDPSGNIDVSIQISDSANDRVDVRVEFDVLGDSSDAGFRLARPAATPATAPTPEFAFADFRPTTDARELAFRWDSSFPGLENDPQVGGQLDGQEVDVVFRFTVREQNAAGSEVVVETEPFRVDNNAPPFVTVGEGALFAGRKDRGKIPVPFQVFDDESDEVQVAVQWRAQGADFPDLPQDAAELTDLLQNPARAGDRRTIQIAEEAPLAYEGRIGELAGLGADQVRLPELAGSAAGLLASGVEGRVLEILRPAGAPSVLEFDTNPFNGPVASLIRGNGSSALVLDSASGGWRVQDVDLESGEVLRTLATGSGTPRALALDLAGDHLLVASTTVIQRVDLFSGNVLASSAHSFADGPRGIASLGTNVVLATGDGELRSIDLSAGSEHVLLTTLDLPWGIVRDPRDPRVVFVADAGADRVVTVSLDTREAQLVPVAVAPGDVAQLGSLPFPTPRSLALEGGRRLLVMCDFGGTPSLRSVDLRSLVDQDAPPDGTTDRFVHEITDQLSDSQSGVATGPDQLRLVTQPAANQVAISGGASQRRRIRSTTTAAGAPPFDPTAQVVQLEQELDPVPPTGTPWRIRAALRAAGSPGGRQHVFLWNSAVVPDSSGVQVRVIARDEDPGSQSEVTGLRPYSTSFTPAPPLPSGSSLRFLDAEDMDADGDLDLLWANESSTDLTVAFQTEPDVFEPSKTLALGTVSPVVTADLDSDGDTDLASVDGDNIDLFLQTSPGDYQAGGSLTPGDCPCDVIPVDFDRDGRVDLAVKRGAADDLLVFLQTESTGQFAAQAEPLLVGELVGTARPDLADVDGDGDIDVIQGATLFLQRADGSFEEIDVPAGPGLADLDADGDLDLYGIANITNQILLGFQEGGGSFLESVPPLPVTAAISFGSLQSVSDADLDNDGDVDLVAATRQGASLFHQVAPRVFVESQRPASDAPSIGDADSGDLRQRVADLNGDGLVDILIGNSNSGEVTVLYQDSTGSFVRTPTLLETGAFPYLVVVADLDQDGDLDIATADGNGDSVSLFFQVSAGTFERAAQLEIFPLGLAAADLDGDGDVDIAVSTSDTLNIFFQTGPGDFSEPPTQISKPDLFRLAAGDVDGDGDVDLVTTGLGLVTVFVQEGGTFSVGDELPSDVRLSPVVMDIDGDGSMDIAAVDSSKNELVLLFQEQPGVFAPEQRIGVGDAPSSIAVADLDGDGDLDLVTANKGSGDLSVLFQSGPGAFSAPAILPAGEAPFSVVAADFDGDGDVDLIAGNTITFSLEFLFTDPSLTLLRQTEPGTFTTVASPLPEDEFGGTLLEFSPIFLATGDLDGDGDVDLAVANASDVAIPSGIEVAESLAIYFNGD